MSGDNQASNHRPDKEKAIPTASFGAGAVGPGAKVGRYKLLSILGEGGYGIVHLAEQQRPVKRRVALKVIKPGMDTKQVIARFEAERQALALLDHPNIAHVYDAGTTKAGRPYFVMEYVKGIPITEHCDRHKLTIEERLRLFLLVCEAIQHAHLKGIIHRDIKPSNIQVSIQAEQAVPKVIDFGVAKAISQPLTERTLVTEQGQFVGTPEYMSPEQAEMTGQDVDTRSDIYSLGVVLYELLTGALPFDPKVLREGGLDHIRRVIREEEPKTPSTRLSTIPGEESTKVAQLRHTDARTLGRKLHGDLDWITLKAMEKDQTRRYQTAQALAEDIERHLNDEPVAAGPPGTLYRMKKCIRRHQALTTGLAAVLLVLLAGIAGIVVFAIKADRQTRIAKAVTTFLGEDLLGAVALQQAMSEEVTVRSILDAASERLKGKFADKPLVEASIRQYLGQTYIELGDYRQAGPYLQRAYDLHRRQLGEKDLRTLDSMSQLGRLYLLQGHYEEAEPLLVQALESRRRILGLEHVDTLQTGVWLGRVYSESSQPDEIKKAEELLTNVFESGRRLLGNENPITLEAMYGLAFMYAGNKGRADKTVPLCFEGWEISKKVLGEGHRLTFDFMLLGAWLKAWEGQFEEAQRDAEIGLETGQQVLGEEHPQTIIAMGILGQILEMQYQPELAELRLTESVRLGRMVLGKEHMWVLHFMLILSRVHMMQGKYQEAESLLKDVLAEGRRSLTDNHMVVRGAKVSMPYLYAMQGQASKLDAWCFAELQRLGSADNVDHSSMARILAQSAWLQATYPSAAIRDGVKAIENATNACVRSGWNNAAMIDTLAAAHAEAGDFATAVQNQNKAIDLVTRRGDVPAATQHFRYCLRLLELGRVIRSSFFTSSARGKIAEGKYGAAEQALTAALTVARRYLGETHPETRGCILAFIELYEAWNKPEKVKEWRAKLPKTKAAEE
jgi:tetratricopeptide (TPR) repeat protein/tRNA A-37 threonylcarbamoyl transferase component Bud32